MEFYVFEDDGAGDLKPLASTRAAFDLRVGTRTILERLCDRFDLEDPGLYVRPTVAGVTAEMHSGSAVNKPVRPDDAAVFLNGRYVALDDRVRRRLAEAASANEPAAVFTSDDTVVAAWIPNPKSIVPEHLPVTETTFRDLSRRSIHDVDLVDRLWHVIEMLPELLADGGQQYIDRRGSRIDTTTLREKDVVVAEPQRIYAAETAAVKPGALLSAEKGPIVIDEQAVVMERAILRGPLYVGPHCQIRPGARIETSALGAHTRVGGEVERSIIQSYTNKMHDGFLGSSYIGAWCNLAADANTATQKNDYSGISVYNCKEDRFEETGQVHLGLFMGDHSRCGINAMFNPGTVVGASCNLFGSGYMPRFVSSFSWGSPDQFAPYRIGKALDVAETAAARKDVEVTGARRQLLREIHARATPTDQPDG